jgi:hypothetical protein
VRTFVAKPTDRPRARLNLAPRLRDDETLSSWLERVAGAYGMRLGDFARWLGYRDLVSYGQPLIDLDVSPPADLAAIMGQHTGISAHVIEGYRLTGLDVLPLRLRRAFCPQCWLEDGPYRRREWSNGWSLVCTRHQQLLIEKPPRQPPISPDAEESWLEFYDTPRLWRDLRVPWEGTRWVAICHALGVRPRTEFARAYYWLRDLQRLAAQTSRGGTRTRNQRTLATSVEPESINPGNLTSPDTSADCHRIPRGGNVGGVQASAVVAIGSALDAWRVKRDLVIYGILKFEQQSLLQILDPTISSSRMIPSVHGAEVCLMVVPEADYDLRLFSAITAQHAWDYLNRGNWRCTQGAKLVEVFGNKERWNDEDWWLERRLRSWPSSLQTSGRKLFCKEDGWTQLPPWSPCRDVCTRNIALRRMLSIRLPRGWQCHFSSDGEDSTEEIRGSGPE